MVSGSDEHGTPITVTAEQNNISPQQVVDQYHAMNQKALLDLGCSWEPHIDPRGIEYGGSLFNRTSDERHKKMVQENFLALHKAGLFETKTMKQYSTMSKMKMALVDSFLIDTSKVHVRVVVQMVHGATSVIHVAPPMKPKNYSTQFLK